MSICNVDMLFGAEKCFEDESFQFDVASLGLMRRVEDRSKTRFLIEIVSSFLLICVALI